MGVNFQLCNIVFFDRLQKRDRSLSFDAEETVELDMVSQPGLKKGLVLVLDAHSDLVSAGTVADDFR